VPNICVEELGDPPEGAAVVAVDDDAWRLLLHAEATTAMITTATNPMKVRLLCFTDPPYQRRSDPRRLQNMTIASLDTHKGVETAPSPTEGRPPTTGLGFPGTHHL
jgi:hypothetical protein